MVDMERAEGYNATGAVEDEAFQVAELSGRGFGKTAKHRGHMHVHGPEATLASDSAARAKRERLNGRALLRNWRRRYEQAPDTRLRRPPEALHVECPHAEVIWLERPHPKYGKAQPHFVPRVVPVEDEHKCVAGVV